MVTRRESDCHPSKFLTDHSVTSANAPPQTTRPYLVLVIVEYVPDVSAYSPPEIAQGVQQNFLAGPGEGQPLQSLSLAFEGVIRTEGRVLRQVTPLVQTQREQLQSIAFYPANITCCSQRVLRQPCSAYRGRHMMIVTVASVP